ncbi:uncharacterized protein [Macaca fascicularis]|uniref:uncharacterized protein n=1 Tax=Macaca fascicularis TaxID=9541 RepID=UPI0032B05090
MCRSLGAWRKLLQGDLSVQRPEVSCQSLAPRGSQQVPNPILATVSYSPGESLSMFSSVLRTKSKFLCWDAKATGQAGVREDRFGGSRGEGLLSRALALSQREEAKSSADSGAGGGSWLSITLWDQSSGAMSPSLHLPSFPGEPGAGLAHSSCSVRCLCQTGLISLPLWASSTGFMQSAPREAGSDETPECCFPWISITQEMALHATEGGSSQG